VTGRDRLRVLFVEDLPSDSELAERFMRADGLEFESMRVETREGFLEALSSFRPDVVVSDYSMPAFDGMTALRLAKAGDPLQPFIVLTGSMNEDTAVECMKAGASDYVIKEHISRLPYAVREAIGRREILEESTRSSIGLRESEARYRSLFEDSHAIMLIIDPENRTIVDANQAACDFYGWPRQRMLGMPMTEYNTLGENAIARNIERALTKTNHHFVFKHRKADGTTVDVETQSGPILLGGRIHLFTIIHDISDRVAAERERDELSARLGHYLAASPTVIYSLRIKDGEAQWQWVSENIQELLGYSPREALESGWWLLNVHAADRLHALGGISKITTNGSFGHEYRFRRKDRETVWLRDEMRFVQSDKISAEIVGTLTDVTDRKRTETELSLRSSALEAAANAIVITDRDGTVRWANPAFERLSGYRREEVVGKSHRDLVKSGVQDAAFYRAFWDRILSGKVWEGELVNRKKDGSLYTEEMTVTPVRDGSGTISSFIAIKSDVTERKLAKERLEASLDEKEVLLREIHHRINNNMQLITSLVHLSLQKVTDVSLHEAIEGISRRIFSMALVHEQFYNSPDLARIDFVMYLRQLADGLYGNFQRFYGKIKVDSNCESVLFDIQYAIPAGMAAAELITNALMHAYPAELPPGEVRVTLRLADGQVELSVRDDGAGLPRSIAADRATSMGMVLVDSLTRQLGGSIEFRSIRGTEAVLRFPLR
jgi:PAS domain S-box-containing protein